MAVAALGLALFAGGCQNISPLPPHAAVVPAAAGRAPKSEAEWRAEAETLAGRYRAKPDDPATALAYAQALRASRPAHPGRVGAAAGIFQHPHDSALLGAYGRALSDVGNYEQALEILNRAHTPDQPDWRILSAQGAVLDQLGRHDEAQSYYSSALKIKPDDPGVLSNLGLSYALAKDLKNAEATLRRAAAAGGTDPRVRQNLALVVGLQGRFGEAESIARADLPPDQAAANVAYLRRMLAQASRLQDGSASADARLRRRHLSRRICGFGRPSQPATGCAKCASGEGHPLSVLTVSYPGGRTRQFSLRGERVAEVCRWLRNYQKLKAAIEVICELNHEVLRPEQARRSAGASAVIKMRRAQLSFGDGLIAAEVDDLCEDWMRYADQVLADELLVAAVYEALGKRRPKSRSRGRQGTPAEVVLRLLILKHIRNWSYEVLEREVRANLVYRNFTRVGGAKMPDAKTMGRLGRGCSAPQVIEQIHERIVKIARDKGVDGRA